MAGRPVHLPRYIERTAMQKLRGGRLLTLESLYPTGKVTVATMVAKGWIEGPLQGATYRMTPAGETALSAQLPIRRRTSKITTPPAVREKDQTKLRRFFEALSSGRSTGRIAYVTTIAAMPQAADGAKWKEDATFNAAEAIQDDPHLKQIYTAAITDGCAIVDRT